MVDDRPEDSSPPGDAGRPRREPPTIDLKATDVSTTPQEAAEAKAEPAPAGAAPDEHVAPASAPVSPWAIAPISGAVAAALVIAVGWALGWPTVQAPPPVAQLNAGAIDDLTTRIAGLESKVSKPATPLADPAAAARMETIEKSVAALRSELTAARAQADKLASAINDAKAAPRDAAAATVDLSAVNERIAQIERAAKAQETEIAGIKTAEAKSAETKSAERKPADDVALRRVVAASLLDVAVRHGDPYAAQLAAAKALSPNADALKPLEAFSASGVPNAAALCRELVAIVPKLAPPAAENDTTGSGVIDRLQAGAAKLVRVQRADTVGTDRSSIVARVTAAALRNDLNEARRELNTLAAPDRAAAQEWIGKADARDAALAASRKYAGDTMAALAQASQ
jgi:hypothetical protein